MVNENTISYFKMPLTIGVTAPSSGVEQHLHLLITEAEKQLIQRGMKVIIGNTTDAV